MSVLKQGHKARRYDSITPETMKHPLTDRGLRGDAIAAKKVKDAGVLSGGWPGMESSMVMVFVSQGRQEDFAVPGFLMPM